MDKYQQSQTSVRLLDDNFTLYVSPWAPGTRAANYFGPITVKGYASRGSAFDMALARTIRRAIVKSKEISPKANSIVGLEINVDPWYDKKDNGNIWIEIRVHGTIANLQPLWKST